MTDFDPGFNFQAPLKKIMYSLQTTFKSLSAALVLTSASSHAATVINPSFESGPLGDGVNASGSFTGWVSTGSSGYQNLPGTTYTPLPTDGDHNAFTNFGSGVLSQVTSEVITANNTYTFTVDVGQLSAFSGSLGTIRIFGSTGGPSVSIAQLTNIAPTPGTYFKNLTVSYTALASGDPFAGQAVGIALISQNDTQVIFDNVRFEVGAVPEPSSMLLGGLGALALLRRRRGM